MPLRLLLVVMARALATTQPASAQLPAARVTVHGIAYDSLRRGPLREAFVTLGGGARNTTTDSRGRFRFDSVEPGSYTIAIHHAMLDSLGFAGISTRAKVTDGRDEVRVAVPSFATLWRRACGTAPPSRDTGFVYGTIRDAETRAPVPSTNVYVSWIDIVIARRKVNQIDWQGRAVSEANGTFALCGVPTDVLLRVQATHDSAASGVVDLQPSDMRVQRLDLLLGPILSTDSTRVGTISGIVTDISGAPFPDTRVALEGAGETRSGPDGRFMLRNVRAGSRQLTFMFVGIEPMTTVVHVVAHDTAIVAMTFGKVTALEAVRTLSRRGVRVLAAEFDERRKSGFGYTQDSLAIVKYPDFVNVLRDVPNLHTKYAAGVLAITAPDGHGGFCAPDVRIDGAPAAFGHLVDLFPKEVAAIEVYPRAGAIPMRFAPTGIKPLCGMILVWTKYGFANK